jgi:hypothetical protein
MAAQRHETLRVEYRSPEQLIPLQRSVLQHDDLVPDRRPAASRQLCTHMTAREVECVELPSLQHSALASGQREELGAIFGAGKHGEHPDRLRPYSLRPAPDLWITSSLTPTCRG